MPINIHLSEIMAREGIGTTVLAERIGLSAVNTSRIKCGQVKAIRLKTLESICSVLRCQPGDILTFSTGEEFLSSQNSQLSEGSQALNI